MKTNSELVFLFPTLTTKQAINKMDKCGDQRIVHEPKKQKKTTLMKSQ